MKPRFLLDEHIDHSIQRQLRRIDPQVDVIAIGDSSSPPVGTSDSDILLWMESSGYILITENRSTIPGHFNGSLCGRTSYAWPVLDSAANAARTNCRRIDRAIFIPL